MKNREGNRVCRKNEKSSKESRSSSEKGTKRSEAIG